MEEDGLFGRRTDMRCCFTLFGHIGALMILCICSTLERDRMRLKRYRDVSERISSDLLGERNKREKA